MVNSAGCANFVSFRVSAALLRLRCPGKSMRRRSAFNTGFSSLAQSSIALCTNGSSVVEALRHADVLRALAGKREHNGTLVVIGNECAEAGHVSECSDGLRACFTVHNQHAAMLEKSAAHLQSESDIGEVEFRMCLQVLAQVGGCLIQSGLGSCRDNE